MNFNYGYILESTAKKIKLELQHKFNAMNVDITVDQWVVLLELHNHGTQNQVSLCEHCTKDAPTMTRIIELLLKKNLILRETEKVDRRKYNISLAKDGKALVKKLLPIVVEFRKKGWEGLTDKDFDLLQRVLNKIQQNFETA